MSLDAVFLDLLLWPRRLEGDLAWLGLRWRPILGAAGTVVVVAVLTALVLWSYRRAGTELSTRRRGGLLILRLAALCCLLPALVELSLQVGLRRQVKPTLAVAIDTSESMSLADKYTTDEQRDSLAAAIAASPESESMSRVEVCRRALSARGGERLGRLSDAADLQLFTFDETARPTAAQDATSVVNGLNAPGQHTHLTASIGEIVDRLRGQLTAGIVLLSDGADNSVISPQSAYDDWRSAGVAIHTVTVGDPEPKDIEILPVLTKKGRLFANDPAEITVQLSQRGYDGTRVPVVLRLHNEELAREYVTFPSRAGDEDEKRTIPVQVRFTPKQAGEHTFRVECPTQPGETVDQNNRQSFVAQVSAEPIRVLYIEQQPRWQYRFLSDALERDRRIDVDILLHSPLREAQRGAEPVPPFINSLPDSREEFERQRYDVIILGDVAPGTLTTRRMRVIRELVRDGEVGLLLLAGPRFNPQAYVDTPLGELCPVEPAEDPSGRAGRRPRMDENDLFRPQLTAAGRTHDVMELADDPDENRKRWESLRKVFWFAPVRKHRPGASVLVEHPTETTETTPAQPMPIMATQPFGKGRVFYCGIDETWRWRFNQGDRVFYRLWGLVIQYLAREERATLSLDKTEFSQGETARVTVRLEETSDTELPPLFSEHEDEDSEPQQHTLTPVPGAEHLFEARVPLARTGLYRLYIEGEGTTRKIQASASIEVGAPRVELQEPAANEELMAEIAANTGGQHGDVGEIDRLIDRLDLSPRVIDEQMTLPLWDRPVIVLLFVCLLGTEWVLRRLWQLP